MTDVVLITPLSRCRSPWPPLSLGYLSSFLEKQGFETKIIDLKSTKFTPYEKNKMQLQLLKLIKKYDPTIVGFTCFTNEVMEVKELNNLIKLENPNIITVVGGPHPTVRPQDFLLDKTFDFVVHGEGEITFYELIKSLIYGKSIKNINGISFLRSNKIFITKPRQPIQNLDSIPFPSYEKMPMDFYTYPQTDLIRGIMISGTTIYTSRGCPYRCIYCSSHTVFGKKTRFRTPKNVVDEIEYLKDKFKIDGFYILDDTFTLSKKHVFGVCNEILERRLDVIWACQTRVHLIDKELILKMKKAGCVQIDFGVESGSSRLLKILKKDITKEQIENAFLICRKMKMRTLANFMMNIPTETFSDINETINFSKKLKADKTVLSVATPFPGTELYEIVKNHDLSIEEFSDLRFDKEPTWYKQPIYRNIKITKLRNKILKRMRGTTRFKEAISPLLFDRKVINVIKKSKRKRQYFNAYFKRLINIIKSW